MAELCGHFPSGYTALAQTARHGTLKYVHTEKKMRGLTALELDHVAGGEYPEKRLPAVVVSGDRVGSISGSTIGNWGVHNSGSTIYFVFEGGRSGTNTSSVQLALGTGVILDGLSSGAFTSGEAAADLINEALGLTGDYAFRDEICAGYMVAQPAFPQEICDLH